MPTPASSVKFVIYEQGDQPRILTVFNPAQNIIYADIMDSGLEAAIGIANLPDSPVKIDFLSDVDCFGFVSKLRRGLYDFDYTSDTSGWPEWMTIASDPDDPLVLSNQASSANTTTEPASTTTTTTAAPGAATINWSFTNYAGLGHGDFTIRVNGEAIVDAIEATDSGTINVVTSSGDNWEPFIGNTTGVEITSISIQYGSDPALTFDGPGNVLPGTYSINDGDSITIVASIDLI